MCDEQGDEQTGVAVRHEQHRRVLINSAHLCDDVVHHPRPEGRAGVGHVEQRRHDAVEPTRAQPVGDGSPGQRTDGRAMHQYEHGLHSVILVEGDSSANSSAAGEPHA
jgi:hypothetical protein